MVLTPNRRPRRSILFCFIYIYVIYFENVFLFHILTLPLSSGIRHIRNDLPPIVIN